MHLRELILSCGSVSPNPRPGFAPEEKNGYILSLKDPFLITVMQVSHSLANILQKFSRLRSLQLDGCRFSTSGLKAVANSCSSLRELSFCKCLGVTDEDLSLISKKNKDLQKLDITCCREITALSIANITRSCPSLRSLKMESCSLVAREAFPWIGEHCRFLEELDLTDNELDDEGPPLEI